MSDNAGRSGAAGKRAGLGTKASPCLPKLNAQPPRAVSIQTQCGVGGDIPPGFVAPIRQIIENGRRHDRRARHSCQRNERKAPPFLLQSGCNTICGGETKGAAARQADGVDSIHQHAS